MEHSKYFVVNFLFELVLKTENVLTDLVLFP